MEGKSNPVYIKNLLSWDGRTDKQMEDKSNPVYIKKGRNNNGWQSLIYKEFTIKITYISWTFTYLKPWAAGCIVFNSSSFIDTTSDWRGLILATR